MIDFHSHIDLFPDPREVARSISPACGFVLSVTTTPSAFAITSAIGKLAPQVETAVGLHPELAAQRHSELPLFERLVSSTRFVGEIGIDGSPPSKASMKLQREVFDTILACCARAGGRIMSIHSRGASREVCESLARFDTTLGTPILHWYSGSLTDLRLALDLGCYFSIGPPMVLTESGIRIIRKIPPNRILTETDGPFVRLGKDPARPGEVGQVLSYLAGLWAVTSQDAAQQVALNANHIFKKHGIKRKIS